jgi:hypothetical protein
MPRGILLMEENEKANTMKGINCGVEDDVFIYIYFIIIF